MQFLGYEYVVAWLMENIAVPRVQIEFLKIKYADISDSRGQVLFGNGQC